MTPGGGARGVPQCGSCGDEHGGSTRSPMAGEGVDGSLINGDRGNGDATGAVEDVRPGAAPIAVRGEAVPSVRLVPTHPPPKLGDNLPLELSREMPQAGVASTGAVGVANVQATRGVRGDDGEGANDCDIKSVAARLDASEGMEGVARPLATWWLRGDDGASCCAMPSVLGRP